MIMIPSPIGGEDVVGTVAANVASGLRREVPSLLVSDKPDRDAKGWWLNVGLPDGLDGRLFARSVRSENVPCVAGNTAESIRVPVWAEATTEEQDHLVLAVTKVAYFMTKSTA
jgi:hypothetical protein